MKITNKYLSTIQLMTIAKSMLEQDTYLGREVCKWLLICSYCTDVELEKNAEGLVILDENKFDELLRAGHITTLYNEIQNHKYADREYESLTDVKVAMSKMIDKISDKIDSFDMSKFNTKDISKFLEVLKNGKNIQ